jgi:hypothetical protein
MFTKNQYIYLLLSRCPNRYKYTYAIDSSRTVKRHKSISRAQGRRSTAVEEDEVREDEGDEASKIEALNSG